MQEESKRLFGLHIRGTSEQIATLRRLAGLAESASEEVGCEGGEAPAPSCEVTTTAASAEVEEHGGETCRLPACADHGLGACPEFLPLVPAGERCPLCGLHRAYDVGQLRELAAYVARLLHRALPLLEAAVHREHPTEEALRGAGEHLSRVRAAIQVAIGWGLVTLGPPAKTLGVSRG